MTQKAVGLALGYTDDTAQTYVARWETGTRPIPRKTPQNLLSLAILLHRL